MVYFHGGGFICGSSALYGADYFMEHDVVIVTVNYRVGALGFLSLDDCNLSVPGNAGLKDQQLALKWVQYNIRNFGGNPKCVTIFGQSAGSASAQYHMLADSSKGLFHGAILQSGSSLCPWASTPPADRLAERLARALGWKGSGGEPAILDTLMAADPVDIVRAQMVRTPREVQRGDWFGFVPSIEPYVSDSSFMCSAPAELASCAWGNELPILSGGVSDEGYDLMQPWLKLSKVVEEERPLDNFLPANFPYPESVRQEKGRMLAEFYNVSALPLTESNIDQIMPILGDKLMWHGIVETVRTRLNAENGSGPTYFYRFSYDSENIKLMKELMTGGKMVQGAVHSDDLLYLWNFDGLVPCMDGIDLKVSKFMVTGFITESKYTKLMSNK